MIKLLKKLLNTQIFFETCIDSILSIDFIIYLSILIGGILWLQNF